MLASDVLNRVSSILHDTGRVRWTAAMLLEYLTDAMRQTVLIRPDSNSTIAIVQLTSGDTRQQIPSGAVRFLSLVRNMTSGGAQPGYPILPTTREAMDGVSATWHSDAESDSIDHYLYNADTPQYFYVYPRPAANVYVEMEYAKDVSELTSLSDVLPLASIWLEPLREYVMYRAFSINAASQVDGARATQHLGQFYLALGEEAKAKALFNPYQQTFQKQ
jgi:hypothetical protein